MFDVDLDSRCKSILDQLLICEDYFTVLDIAIQNKISKRSAYNTIHKINDFLKDNKVEPIEFDRNNGVLLNADQRNKIKRIFQGEQENVLHIFSPMERVSIIICTLIISRRKYVIEDFMGLCQVSRSTIINDLKLTSAQLREYNLELNYITKVGYLIEGDEIKKRAIYFLLFSQLQEYYYNGALRVEEKIEILNYLTKLTKIENKLETKYVEGTLLMLALFIPYLYHCKEHISFHDNDELMIRKTKEYELVCEGFLGLKDKETIYLALHLLGSRLQTTPITFHEEETDAEIIKLSKSFVSEFCRIACVEFKNLEGIETSLFYHLKTSLYRYRYGIQLGNPMLSDIKNQYPELFEITKKASEYLNKEIGFPISDSEIAYLTLHFSGLINMSKNETNEMNILIVCPNGISTGNLLKSEVALLIPHATKVDIVDLRNVDSIIHEYDTIISTIKLDIEKPSILVHPILTDRDRFLILKKCMKHEMTPKIEIRGVMSIIKKHIQGEDLSELEKDLTKYLEIRSPLTYTSARNNHRGLLDFINSDMIRYVVRDVSWQEAIQLSGEVLIEYNFISSDYVKAIIELIDEFGSYMFLNENVMIAHAKIEDGVNTLGLSVGVFPKGVAFPEGKVAKIIFVLAAEDQNKHLKILKDLMSIFSKEESVSLLMECIDEESIVKKMEEMLQEKREL